MFGFLITKGMTPFYFIFGVKLVDEKINSRSTMAAHKMQVPQHFRRKFHPRIRSRKHLIKSRNRFLFSPENDITEDFPFASYIIIYLKKSPYNLPLGRSCKYIAILDYDLCFIERWPQPGFSANSRAACVLCLRYSFVYYVCVTKAWAVGVCPTGMKKENIPCKHRVKMVFSGLKHDLIIISIV